MPAVVDEECVFQVELARLVAGRRRHFPNAQVQDEVRFVDGRDQPIEPVSCALTDFLAAADVVGFGAQKVLGVDAGRQQAQTATPLLFDVDPEEEAGLQLAQHVRHAVRLAHGTHERETVV